MNGYAYARNNPLILFDPTGEKVELVAKPIISGIGNHMFYRVTPDNPGEINIQGVPAGAEQFTFGAYNPDWGSGSGFNNRLQKAIGYEGHNGISTDFGAEGRASMVIAPPEEQSDSEFINSLGAAYNKIGDNQNYFFGGNATNRFGYSNSNNFAYQLGTNVGVKNQLNSFNPQGFEPGFSRGLAPGGQPSISQSTINYFQSRINAIKSQIETLQSKI